MDAALRLTSPFGGGVGRLREICGAVTGMPMVKGVKFGYADPKDDIAKAAHYPLIQSLALTSKEKELFLHMRGAVGSGGSRKRACPKTRTKEYDQTRPCANLTICAADIPDELTKMKDGPKRHDKDCGSVREDNGYGTF